MLDDPLRSLAIPFRRNGPLFPLPCHQSREDRRQFARVGTNEFVRPNRDSLGTLCLSSLFGLFGLSCLFG